MNLHRWMRRGLARGLAGLLLLAPLAGVAQADAPAAVWALKGARNTVYLAGSVHALPKSQAYFPPQLELAYDASDAIVMEVDLDDLDPLEAVHFLSEHGTLTAPLTLADIIGEDKYSRVADLAASIELPELAISRLEPWAAAMIITQFALIKTGFDPQLGIDMQLTERARADNKPIDGLETVGEQLGIFDARSTREQVKFLLDATRDVPDMQRDLDRLVAAWRTGNLRALEREFRKERKQAPALYDELLGARNRRWLPKIEALLEEDRNYLVVVGTLHFVGRDGLLALLEGSGHKAVMVPAAPVSATN